MRGRALAPLLITLMVIAIAPCLRGQAPRAFEFKGIHFPDSLANGHATKNCMTESAGLVACMSIAAEADPLMLVLTREYWQGRLMTVSGVFPSGDFPTLVRAMTLQFGEPSGSRVDTVQTAVGGRVVGAATSWALTPGTLWVRQIGSNRADYGEFLISDPAVIDSRRAADDSVLRKFVKPR